MWFDPSLTVDPIVAALLVWLVADHINVRAKIARMYEDIKYLRQRIEELAGDPREHKQ